MRTVWRVCVLLAGLVAPVAEKEAAVSYPVIIHDHLKSIFSELPLFECVKVRNFTECIKNDSFNQNMRLVSFPLSEWNDYSCSSILPRPKIGVSLLIIRKHEGGRRSDPGEE